MSLPTDLAGWAMLPPFAMTGVLVLTWILFTITKRFYTKHPGLVLGGCFASAIALWVLLIRAGQAAL